MSKQNMRGVVVIPNPDLHHLPIYQKKADTDWKTLLYGYAYAADLNIPGTPTRDANEPNKLDYTPSDIIQEKMIQCIVEQGISLILYEDINTKQNATLYLPNQLGTTQVQSVIESICPLVAQLDLDSISVGEFNQENKGIEMKGNVTLGEVFALLHKHHDNQCGKYRIIVVPSDEEMMYTDHQMIEKELSQPTVGDGIKALTSLAKSYILNTGANIKSLNDSGVDLNEMLYTELGQKMSEEGYAVIFIYPKSFTDYVHSAYLFFPDQLGKGQAKQLNAYLDECSSLTIGRVFVTSNKHDGGTDGISIIRQAIADKTEQGHQRNLRPSRKPTNPTQPN